MPLGVHQGRVIIRDIGLRIGQQAALRLKALHHHGIGDQQDIGLRASGGELGLEPRHDLRGAVADPVDLDIGMKGGEGIDGALRIRVGLRGVKDEPARDVLRLREGRQKHQGGDKRREGRAFHSDSFCRVLDCRHLSSAQK